MDEYLLVHKSVLPDYFSLVVECRELIEEAKMSVSDACKKLNISRSTYYKYKDFVFEKKTSSTEVAIIAIRMDDKKGLLGSVLSVISEHHGNIITLNQDMPINQVAYITISINIKELSISVSQLVKKINNIAGVKLVELLAIE